MIHQNDFKKLSNTAQIWWLDGLLDKVNSHDGKIGYSENSAIKAADAMEKKYNRLKRFDVYKCLWCEFWHIGKSVK